MKKEDLPAEVMLRAQEDEIYRLWLKEVHRCAPAYFQIRNSLTPVQKNQMAAYESAQNELSDILLQIAYQLGQEHGRT